MRSSCLVDVAFRIEPSGCIPIPSFASIQDAQAIDWNAKSLSILSVLSNDCMDAGSEMERHGQGVG